MKQEIIKFLKTTGMQLSKQSPHICAGLAVAGVIGTTILAIRAQKHAQNALDAEETKRLNEATYKDEDDIDRIDSNVELPHTAKEKLAITWKCYIPPVISAASTIGMIIASDTINAKRIATIGALYAASQETLADMKEKTKELVGEKKAKEIENAALNKQVERIPYADDICELTGHGEQLFFDTFAGRWFKSNADYVRSGINSFNTDVINTSWQSLNDLYDLWNIRESDIGNKFGFRSGEQLKVSYAWDGIDDHTPFCKIIYETNPTAAWDY